MLKVKGLFIVFFLDFEKLIVVFGSFSNIAPPSAVQH